MSKAAAQALKAAGNDFFKNKNYENAALKKWTDAAE
jgi:hypothetical protein